MIGWIHDDGLWLVTAADADRLPIGAAVVQYADPDGLIEDPAGAQARTELGWAGPEVLGDRLDPTAAYWVRWPLNANDLDDWPATSRAEFERGLARPDDDFGSGLHIGYASCEHGSPIEGRSVYPAIGA